MEMSMRTTFVAALLATALAAPLAGSASAQSYSPEVMTSCQQAVGQMKFEGWPADRFREMTMSACQHNGGLMPGGQQQQQPASLPRQPARQRTAPRGGY
jgi:hypothetical protein